VKISLLCSDPTHPIQPYLRNWCAQQSAAHAVELVHGASELSGGDLLFLISCAEIIGADVRNRYRASLVIHASDLPDGKGWSPLVWQIADGHSDITVTLLEAANEVDSGPIWHKVRLHFQGHELVDEIHAVLFAAELALMDYAVANCATVVPTAQPEIAAERAPRYYRRRTPEDSRIDPERSLAEQFNLLRVADSARYPAFFDFLGHRYEISLKKVAPDER
jgi:methionyl-tRNA formyltransferase